MDETPIKSTVLGIIESDKILLKNKYLFARLSYLCRPSTKGLEVVKTLALKIKLKEHEIETIKEMSEQESFDYGVELINS